MLLILSVLSLILCVPFILLIERRLLGILQLRLGVFMYLFQGLFVFLADFLKILTKWGLTIFVFNTYVFYGFCFMFFFTSLWIFCSMAYFIKLTSYPIYWGYILFLCLFIFIPFPFLNIAYISNSIYALLGALRYIYVLISVELILSFSFFILVWFSVPSFIPLYGKIVLFGAIFVLYISILIDVGRLPFDLTEAESELVAGYSTELSSIIFLVVFFSEYIILFTFWFLLSHLLQFSLIIIITFTISLRALFLRCHYQYIFQLFWLYFLVLLILIFLWCLVVYL